MAPGAWCLLEMRRKIYKARTEMFHFSLDLLSCRNVLFFSAEIHAMELASPSATANTLCASRDSRGHSGFLYDGERYCAQFITIEGKQILARAVGMQKVNKG